MRLLADDEVLSRNRAALAHGGVRAGTAEEGFRRTEGDAARADSDEERADDDDEEGEERTDDDDDEGEERSDDEGNEGDTAARFFPLLVGMISF